MKKNIGKGDEAEIGACGDAAPILEDRSLAGAEALERIFAMPSDWMVSDEGNLALSEIFAARERESLDFGVFSERLWRAAFEGLGAEGRPPRERFRSAAASAMVLSAASVPFPSGDRDREALEGFAKSPEARRDPWLLAMIFRAAWQMGAELDEEPAKIAAEILALSGDARGGEPLPEAAMEMWARREARRIAEAAGESAGESGRGESRRGL